MNFDELLGLPSGDSLRGAPDVRPDFFPQLDSAISVDQTSQSGRTLLRFGTQVNNQGLGPAILISGRPGIDPIPVGAPITSWVNPDGSQNVLQAVYKRDPDLPFGQQFSLSYYRNGGLFTYHQGHSHFHYDGYAYYRLRHNVAGQPGGYVNRPDGTGVVGEKTGFCLINTSSSFTMENGQSSTTIPGYASASPYNGQPGTGWTFVVFQPGQPGLQPGSLNLAAFINYVGTRKDKAGVPLAKGTEYLSSVEFGVEPQDGTGDITMHNFRVWK